MIKKLLFQFLLQLLTFGGLFGALNLSEPSIIFVHLGDQLPIYLETAVKQARSFNSCNIIVVANATALQKAQQIFTRYQVISVACESLRKTQAHTFFLQHSKLDTSFRKGFWSFATERFLYLHDLLQQYDLHDIVHLENDNMIYCDISSLLPIFHKQYPHIGITLDNDERCIPGFVYIADAASMDSLAQWICQEASHRKNDMQSLASYFKKFGTTHADQLPIIMNEYVQDNELISPTKMKAKNKFNYCKHDELFHSIFDAAALGQYVGGVDPRNCPSKPGFINESCVFNPSLLHISWKKDNLGRKIPYATYKSLEYRINNLHIHSKFLHRFLSLPEE